MSAYPKDFLDFKRILQDVFDGNERGLELLGKNLEVQLKTYLIESTVPARDALQGLGASRRLDIPGWFLVELPNVEGMVVLDASQTRVWRLFSLIGASSSDDLVEDWIRRVPGLDRCWLSRKQLLRWEGEPGWSQRGVGLHFSDGLTAEENRGNLSLKAWHGARNLIPGLKEVIEKAQEAFAISSVRWQRVRAGETTLVAESYSDGKITINRATDVDEALNFTAALGGQYRGAIDTAATLRDQSMAPFEFQFSQSIDLDAFREAVGRGRGPMRLWLVEVEAEPDFRRFRGVDMHTWDRVLLDIGPTYGYLTVPAKGCVNAAPRIAALQGEDNSGRTSILFDGVEMFV